MSDTKVLAKIQNLLNLADHPDTPPAEAESARAMAERMMTRYAIEEHMLIQAGQDGRSRTKPVAEDLSYASADSRIILQYFWLLHVIAQHNRCRVHGTYGGTAKIVGFESDVWMAQMMYAGVKLHLMSKADPKPDLNLDYDTNVYTLHEAGINWERIARMMNTAIEGMDEDDAPWPPTPWPDGGRLIRAAKRRAKEEGLSYTPKANPKLYQQSFAEGYYHTISARLYKMQKVRDQEAGEAGAVVLRDRKDEVDEAFYLLYPWLRPETPEQRAAREAKEAQKPSKPLRARKYREQARDWAAMDAGSEAARHADLTGGSGGGVSRVSNNEIGG